MDDKPDEEDQSKPTHSDGDDSAEKVEVRINSPAEPSADADEPVDKTSAEDVDLSDEGTPDEEPSVSPDIDSALPEPTDTESSEEPPIGTTEGSTEPTEPDDSPQPAGDESAYQSPEPATSELGSSEPEAITPPLPGDVVSHQDAPSEPPRIVTSDQGQGRGRMLKAFLLLLIIILLAVGGYFAYQKHHKATKSTATVQSKDIPLLRIGIKQADYGGIYPNISDNDYSVTVNSQMFEGLVRYEDRSKIVPDLASTWTNPDDNTWLFTIKKGVKFHDGHTLTPADVKYSLDNMVGGSSDFAQTFAATIASVELVGTDQVKITTKSPDPTLLNKLTLLYVIDANAPKGAEPSLAGTGPYEIKTGTTPTDNSVQMVAFNGYHDGRPTTQALAFSDIADNPTLIKDFNAGQYDIAGTLSPGTSSQAKNATIFNVSEADSDYIAFNTIQPSPVQNKLVREAIRYAVSAAALGKANGENLTPLGQVVPPSIPGYDPAITPYKQNIDKAKQLLAQAGYPNGLALTLSAATVSKPEATELSNELKQVGITVTLDPHSDFDEYINYFTAGKAEMYIVDYASDTLDAADIYQSTLPSANYNNPKVNDLLTQANTALNPATRLKLLQQVAVLVDQDVPIIPLGTTADTWVMNKNYDIQQDSTSGYLPVYFYTVKLK